MYNWLINHRIFGSYIHCYLVYKAVPMRTKIGALIFLWSTLSISAVLVPSLHIKIFLMVVGIGVTIHLITLKTMSAEDIRAAKDLKKGSVLQK